MVQEHGVLVGELPEALDIDRRDLGAPGLLGPLQEVLHNRHAAQHVGPGLHAPGLALHHTAVVLVTTVLSPLGLEGLISELHLRVGASPHRPSVAARLKAAISWSLLCSWLAVRGSCGSSGIMMTS